MIKKILLTVLVLVIVGGVSFYFMVRTTSVTSDCNTKSESEVIITLQKDNTFSPPCVKVKSGTKITWVNNGDELIELGADPHPLHTGKKEVSNNLFTLDLKPGEQSTVTLTTKGTHGYHDHRRFSSKGVIEVE